VPPNSAGRHKCAALLHTPAKPLHPKPTRCGALLRMAHARSCGCPAAPPSLSVVSTPVGPAGAPPVTARRTPGLPVLVHGSLQLLRWPRLAAGRIESPRRERWGLGGGPPRPSCARPLGGGPACAGRRAGPPAVRCPVVGSPAGAGCRSGGGRGRPLWAGPWPLLLAPLGFASRPPPPLSLGQSAHNHGQHIDRPMPASTTHPVSDCGRGCAPPLLL